jgi:hypothetical protein
LPTASSNYISTAFAALMKKATRMADKSSSELFASGDRSPSELKQAEQNEIRNHQLKA